MGSVEIPQVTYGFIGIGNMGFPMAQHLRRHLADGLTLVICDVVESITKKFVAETPGKIEVAKTPKEVAQKCDIIITILPVGRHVKEVYTNSTTGLLSIPAGQSPKLFIECSTIDVPTSLDVGKAVALSGLGRFADVPVSGGPTGARAATLTFMAGGDEQICDAIQPIAMTMGRTFYRCGKPGAGLATKQINNYLSGICMVSTAEAMNLGMKYGLDPHVLAGVINTSTGMSYNSKEQNPVKGVSSNSSANRDFAPGFTIELCKGVLEMVAQLGSELEANMPLCQALLDTIDAASKDDRCRGKDCRVVYKYIADVE
ncbi:3-hydroxyisobutyrate dehydrogenase, variant [Talaromyces proteolyticus]|uniref:3-hydroxyisobutyrate dehydrogenase, variant n=1 Tax=Talaromyces proteolyticus TaxID=1131652 RepID=A0AAD4KED4_9EURO|nr:3-hydroxyisobutyrate dehydrogenase, variant [Talaromyces proteolyticus]KAH8689055.1 3-hydroxyisobutyrate dehydrogenase, variant [Talaromyces proteolyticus]